MLRFLFVLPLVVACKTTEPTDSTPDVVDTEVVDTEVVDTTPECGPTELCSRSINECEIEMDQGTCEGWYANEANCADMAAYTACNCDCMAQATCDGYFACGNLCFNDACE